MSPTQSSKNSTLAPLRVPRGRSPAIAVRAACGSGLRSTDAGPVVGQGTGPAVGVRHRCAGRPCAWLRLHGRRLRDCAQAARFARARPDGRPAGALHPAVGAGSRLVRHTTRPERAKEDTHEPLDRHRAPDQGPEVPGDRERDRDLHAADRRQARRQAGPRRVLRRQVLRRPGVGVRAVPQERARDRRRRPPAVRRVPDPGRRLRLPRLHRRRARRVPRQPQPVPPVRPATRPPPISPPRTARRARPTRPPDHHRGPAAQHRPRARRLPR